MEILMSVVREKVGVVDGGGMGLDGLEKGLTGLREAGEARYRGVRIVGVEGPVGVGRKERMSKAKGGEKQGKDVVGDKKPKNEGGGRTKGAERKGPQIQKTKNQKLF